MDGVFQERILAPETTDQWLWILIVAAFGAFFAAFGIGANDVANAFATSVGAKALTIKQAAVVLAGIFEFLGAVFLGSHVTKTIRKGIADVRHDRSERVACCFEDNPGILMYGNMCVVYTTGIWLLLASFFELPVSTTHSTIGGIVGMAMTYRGADCVVWYEEAEMFPYLKGVSAIVASWALSPVLSGIIAVFLFLFVRTFVLRSADSYKRAVLIFPFLVTATVAVNVFFIVYKGAKGLDLDETSLSTAFAYALGLGCGCGLIMIPTVLPYMRKNIAAKFNEDGTLKPVAETEAKAQQTGVVGFVMNQMNQDIHSSVKDSEYVSAIHDNAEKFDPRAEEAFKYVQVRWFRHRARVRHDGHHRHPPRDPPLHHPLPGRRYDRRGSPGGSRRRQRRRAWQDRVRVDHHHRRVRHHVRRHLRPGGLRALRLRHHRTPAGHLLLLLRTGG
ncbi:unnamed protein product [Scytosiphon promiscuus]